MIIFPLICLNNILVMYFYFVKEIPLCPESAAEQWTGQIIESYQPQIRESHQPKILFESSAQKIHEYFTQQIREFQHPKIWKSYLS